MLGSGECPEAFDAFSISRLLHNGTSDPPSGQEIERNRIPLHFRPTLIKKKRQSGVWVLELLP